MSIHELGLTDERALAQVLAEAFLQNPLNCAVIGRNPPTRRRVNRAGMDLTLGSARGVARVLTVLSEHGELAGGLIAVPPGQWPLPPPLLSQQIVGLFRQGLRVTSRWGQVYSKLAQRHPEEPHWYLSTLGIDPRYQRKGLASRLLDYWLCEVDEENARVYLETDHPQSLSFYLNRGFRVCEEMKLLGVPIWRMSRSTDSGSA